MTEVCRSWSLTEEQSFQGLCSMVVEAETENPTKQCTVEITPIEVPV